MTVGTTLGMVDWGGGGHWSITINIKTKGKCFGSRCPCTPPLPVHIAMHHQFYLQDFVVVFKGTLSVQM